MPAFGLVKFTTASLDQGRCMKSYGFLHGCEMLFVPEQDMVPGSEHPAAQAESRLLTPSCISHIGPQKLCKISLHTKGLGWVGLSNDKTPTTHQPDWSGKSFSPRVKTSTMRKHAKALFCSWPRKSESVAHP